MRIIFVVLLIWNFIFLISKKKSRLTFPIWYVYIGILYNVGCKYANDYGNYYQMYYHYYGANSYEVVFNLLMDTSRFIGLDISMFYSLCWIIFGGVLVFVFRQFSDNFELFFTVYSFYFLFTGMNLLRYSCAISVITLAFYYYINGEQKKACITAMVSVLLHASMAFFIPFILLWKSLKKIISSHNFKYIISFSIFSFALLFVIDRKIIDLLINIVIKLFIGIGASYKTDSYLASATRWGGFLYFSIFMVSVVCMHWMKLRYKGNNPLMKNSMNIVNELQYYCFVALPFMFINTNFYRFLLAILLISFCVWGMWIDYMSKNKRKNEYYMGLIFILISSLVYRLPFVQGVNQLHQILSQL